MSLSAFLLVLSAAACHATWNFFVKRINGGPELVWLFSVVTVVLYGPFALWLLFADPGRFGLVEIGVVLVSAALHMAYFLLLQQGYRRGDLSLIYPTARATGPLLAAGVAVGVLGERLDWRIALGGILIVVGVLFLTGGLRRRARHAALSLGFGLGVGALIATYTVWDAYAVKIIAVQPLLLDYTSSLFRSVVLAPYAVRRRTTWRAQWRDHRAGVIVIALFNPLAYILVLVALTFTPVVYVAPVREVSVLFSVVLGALLLGEGSLGPRFKWALVILAGVALLATA